MQQTQCVYARLSLPDKTETEAANIEFVDKVWTGIEHYGLKELFVITRSPGKTAMTFCNLWRLTKYHNDPRIVLHEFSLRSWQWKETDPASIRWANASFAYYLRRSCYVEDDRDEETTETYFKVPSTIFCFENSIAYPERFLQPIWPNIKVFALFDDNLCRWLTLLLLRKLLCEDDATFFVDRLVIEERKADLLRIWEYCTDFARFRSGFKWGDVRRILWEDFLDKKLMSALCAKNHGVAITLGDYLAALPYARDILRIADETRGLLPLLNAIPPQHWGRRDLFRNETLRETSPAFADLGDTHLRLLRKLPVSVLCKLYYRCGLRDVLDVLLGMQVQEKIPAAVLLRVVKHSWRLLATLPEVNGAMPALQRIYRLYVRHALELWKQQGRKKLQRYLRNERDLVRIMDWFLAEGLRGGLPDKNATWASLIRTSEAWHTRLAEAHAGDNPADGSPATDLSWSSLLGETNIAGVSVRPLESGLALQREGEDLRHCVASYAPRCLKLSFRIFSLTEGSGVRSTLCICPGPSRRWTVFEHRGVRDCEVSLRARKAAREVCRLYEEAEKSPLAAKRREAA